MSGGYFNYDQYRINWISDSIEELIQNEMSDDVDGWGYSVETINEFKKAVEILKVAAIYAQRIDWLVSCDDGEESFHKRLNKDLENLAVNTDSLFIKNCFGIKEQE